MYKEIINQTPKLPIKRKKGEDFRKCLFSVLDYYSKKNNELNNDTYLNDKVNKLSNGIKKTIDAYYEGNPSKAYRILSTTLKETDLLIYLNKKSLIHNGSNLYRIRIKDSNYPLNRKEIFHIPYNLRELVATQRYSIPGLPSLYLANSIYVAWEELGRPSSNLIQAARFKNTRDLKLLDLSSDIYYEKKSLLFDNNDLSNYDMIVWPLIAACSVKVPDRNVAFKPEYIIPQLLLQWINKNELDGIKYSSTHINKSINKHIGKLYNIVIPVKSFKQSEGFCKELLNTFEVSNVMPMQLNQFSLNEEKDNQIPSELHQIELIKGKQINYSETIFGKVEILLKNLKTGKIPVANTVYN